MQPPVEIVLFDVDGVVTTGGTFALALEREHGISGKQLGPFFQEAFGPCLVGQADLKEALLPYLAGWGWHGGVDAFLAFWFRAEHRVDRELVEEVRRLRALGLPCYLVTNQERYRSGYLWEQMGLGQDFDGIFSSGFIGARKPQPEFFQHVLRRLAVAPQAVLFWDDTAANVEAARLAGLRAERYAGIQEFRATMARYLRPDEHGAL